MGRISKLACLVVSVVVLGVVSGIARASTVIIDASTRNGSFESGTNGDTQANFGAYYVLDAGSTTELTDWKVGGTNNSYYVEGDGVAYDGARRIDFAVPDASADQYSISQSFAVTAGDIYTVSYYEGTRAGATATLVAEIALAAGGYSGTVSQTANNQTLVTSSHSTWQLFTFNFTPDTNTTATLTFTAGTSYTDFAPGYGSSLDNVSVTETIPAPEPASLGLLAVGSMLVLRRRR